MPPLTDWNPFNYMREQEINVTEDMIRESAGAISDADIIADEVAPPLYDNGMSDAVRTFLNDSNSIASEVSENLSVFS